MSDIKLFQVFNANVVELKGNAFDLEKALIEMQSSCKTEQ